MKHEVMPDGRLKLTVDEKEKNHLQYLRDDKNATMVEFSIPDGWGMQWLEETILEPLIANSELEWIPEWVTGDLTSAPMLGVLGEPQAGGNGPLGAVLAGRWEDASGVIQGFFSPVTHRWAWMHYQVRSFLDDLADSGECIWEGGAAL